MFKLFSQFFVAVGDLHKGEGEPSNNSEANHQEVVLHSLRGVWPCLKLAFQLLPGDKTPSDLLHVHEIIKQYQYYTVQKICWHGFYFSHNSGCDFFLVLFHTVPDVPVTVLK